METERITIEASRLCRTCGAESLHMFPLSARDPNVNLRLDDMLMACTDLKIHEGDGLPSSICYNCTDELRSSYRFKQQCETTGRYFNELRLKSNEIKQEQETVVLKECENEYLLELKEEMDTDDNSSIFKEVTEGISEAVVISRETKQEQGDSLTITETLVYKQEENFSKGTENEAIRVGNFEDSPPNEDLCLEDFPNKMETRNTISKEAKNEFPSGSKEQKEEETIHNSITLCFEPNIYGEYSWSSNLRIHKQIHENGERKRFKCDICEKSFAKSMYLWKHKQTHKNGGRKCFKCEICEKSFVTSCYLRHHMQRHENGRRKRFKCDLCEESFVESRDLGEHRLTHKNNILYEQK